MNKQLYIPATMLAAFVGDSPYMSQQQAIDEVLLKYYYKTEVIEEEVVLDDELMQKAVEIMNSESITKEQQQLLDSMSPEVRDAIVKGRGLAREATAFDKLNEYFKSSKKYSTLTATQNCDKHYHYVSDDCIIGGVVDGFCYDTKGEFRGIIEIKNRMYAPFKKEKLYERKTDLYQVLTYYKALGPYFENLLPADTKPVIGLVQVCNGKVYFMDFDSADLDSLWSTVEPKIKTAMKMAHNRVIENAMLLF